MKTDRLLVVALAAALLLPLWACERDEPVTPADVGGGGSPAVEEPIPTPEPEPEPDPEPIPDPEPDPEPITVSMTGTMWRCEIYFEAPWLPEKSPKIEYWTFETDSTVLWRKEIYYDGIVTSSTTDSAKYWFRSDSLAGEIYKESQNKAFAKFVYDTAQNEIVHYGKNNNGLWVQYPNRFYRVY